MKRIFTSLALFGLCSCCFAQLITKKESQQINQLLDSLSTKLHPRSCLFRNATVITMKDSIPLLNHDVLVEDGVIKDIGTNLQIDSTVLEIDARGKYLLPGLIDMHAHLFPQHPMVNTWKIHFLLSGVTSIRDMNGVPGKQRLELRDAINQNKLFAPTLYQASQPIDSKESPFFQFAKTSEEGQRLVREAKQVGFDFIKVYDGLTPDVYHAIIEQAGRLQIPVVGHIPSAITLEEALKAGQNSIEHLIGYFEWKGVTIQLTAAPDYAIKTAQSDTWVCPTLFNHHLNLSRASAQAVLNDSTASLLPKGLYENWLRRTKDQSKNVVEMVDKHGAASFDVLQNIVQSLYKADSKLIAGTDAGNLPFLIPGSSLIEELKLLSQMRIPNYSVLKMATSEAAHSMGKQQLVGTIEEGMRADLILLDRDPLETLNNLYTNRGVMVRGCWISDADRNRISGIIEKIFKR